ncbi:uncharacterized protein MYCFIDRAFT_176629 [Pseudocercospora fijiensis CIRAD86]|uniref:Uncharacterized protein n=1 Tax=Pseudocercospora fijiensis (strain CIRAD86) TaxID=383855 RepID=M2ZQJ2_PSEFD|nr:uncharacterized protein MYCFIDRAFT_176629 [Pseudocercospora fijiensis CIRAD86]EME81344.1 hypothetical protein MYCFIDRAFT_176629 [Pseudocercospora fijiensis CIRAD86]
MKCCPTSNDYVTINIPPGPGNTFSEHNLFHLITCHIRTALLIAIHDLTETPRIPSVPGFPTLDKKGKHDIQKHGFYLERGWSDARVELVERVRSLWRLVRRIRGRCCTALCCSTVPSERLTQPQRERFELITSNAVASIIATTMTSTAGLQNLLQHFHHHHTKATSSASDVSLQASQYPTPITVKVASVRRNVRPPGGPNVAPKRTMTGMLGARSKEYTTNIVPALDEGVYSCCSIPRVLYSLAGRFFSNASGDALRGWCKKGALSRRRRLESAYCLSLLILGRRRHWWFRGVVGARGFPQLLTGQGRQGNLLQARSHRIRDEYEMGSSEHLAAFVEEERADVDLIQPAAPTRKSRMIIIKHSSLVVRLGRRSDRSARWHSYTLVSAPVSDYRTVDQSTGIYSLMARRTVLEQALDKTPCCQSSQGGDRAGHEEQPRTWFPVGWTSDTADEDMGGCPVPTLSSRGLIGYGRRVDELAVLRHPLVRDRSRRIALQPVENVRSGGEPKLHSFCGMLLFPSLVESVKTVVVSPSNTMLAVRGTIRTRSAGVGMTATIVTMLMRGPGWSQADRYGFILSWRVLIGPHNLISVCECAYFPFIICNNDQHDQCSNDNWQHISLGQIDRQAKPKQKVTAAVTTTLTPSSTACSYHIGANAAFLLDQSSKSRQMTAWTFWG